jgi:hypothetical protein
VPGQNTITNARQRIKQLRARPVPKQAAATSTVISKPVAVTSMVVPKPAAANPTVVPQPTAATPAVVPKPAANPTVVPQPAVANPTAVPKPAAPQVMANQSNNIAPLQTERFVLEDDRRAKNNDLQMINVRRV